MASDFFASRQLLESSVHIIEDLLLFFIGEIRSFFCFDEIVVESLLVNENQTMKATGKSLKARFPQCRWIKLAAASFLYSDQ